MPIRSSKAIWNGTLKEGHGQLKFGSGVYEGKYSFGSRFEEEPGTNPEELIAAAHAGCFTMFMSALLTEKGFIPKELRTSARVHLGAGPEITKIELINESVVEGISADAFQEIANEAKKNCPISKALAAVPMELTAKLL